MFGMLPTPVSNTIDLDRTLPTMADLTNLYQVYNECCFTLTPSIIVDQEYLVNDDTLKVDLLDFSTG